MSNKSWAAAAAAARRATDHANSLTERANASGSKGDHAAARDAHQHAGELHDSARLHAATFSGRNLGHLDISAHHESAAKQHDQVARGRGSPRQPPNNRFAVARGGMVLHVGSTEKSLSAWVNSGSINRDEQGRFASK